MNKVSFSADQEVLSIQSRAFAVFLGTAIPSLVFGRVVFGGIVFIAVLCLCFSDSSRGALRNVLKQAKSAVGFLICLTFVVWVLSALYSISPVRSLEAVIRTLFFIVLASVFYSALIKNYRILNLAIRAFVLTAAISVSFGLLSITVLPEVYWALRLEGWKSDPVGTRLKGFSNLSVFIIPILIGVSSCLQRFWKSIAILSILLFVVFVLANYNRSAIAGFLSIFIVVGTAFCFRGHGKGNVLLWITGVLGSIILTLVWLWQSRGFRQEVAEIQAQSLQGKLIDPKMLDLSVYEGISPFFFPLWLVVFERQIIWKGAVEIGSVSPWFGVGANAINYAPGADQFIARTNFLHLIPGHPHNWVVEILAETGILGLSSLLALILCLGAYTIKSWWSQKNLGLIMVLAIMAGYWGSGLFNFSYWSAWWQTSFFLSLAFCYAFAKSTRV